MIDLDQLADDILQLRGYGPGFDRKEAAKRVRDGRFDNEEVSSALCYLTGARLLVDSSSIFAADPYREFHRPWAEALIAIWLDLPTAKEASSSG